MSELENFVAKQIKTLVPHYDKVELEAVITSSSYSIEFFAIVNGQKKQSFQMIDECLFSEKAFNAASKAIADYVRALPSFNKDGLNKYALVLK